MKAVKLTDAELTVLEMLIQDLTQQEIAYELNRSVNTIQTHYASIKKKLKCRTMHGLTAKAVHFNIVIFKG